VFPFIKKIWKNPKNYTNIYTSSFIVFKILGFWGISTFGILLKKKIHKNKKMNVFSLSC
jgi:hypothetical protein